MNCIKLSWAHYGFVLAFPKNCFACSSNVPSSFRKSRKTLNRRGYCLFVSGAFRAYKNMAKGSCCSSITVNYFHIILYLGLNKASRLEWAGSDSNQRPPPCQGGILTRLDHRPLYLIWNFQWPKYIFADKVKTTFNWNSSSPFKYLKRILDAIKQLSDQFHAIITSTIQLGKKPPGISYLPHKFYSLQKVANWRLKL